MRCYWARSPLGGRAQQLAPFFFGILILRSSHAAFGILAFKRILFPCDAVSKLFHQLLTLGTDDKVGEQQGRGMGRISYDGRSTRIRHSHVQWHPVDGRTFSFMTITWFRKIVGDPAISPAISRFRKPRLASLNNLTSCSLSFFTKPSPLYFSIEPITRALELSVVTASLPLRSGFSRS